MPASIIATGPPGSGKSTTLSALCDDVTVVPEAASAVVEELLAEGVAQPERHPEFLERIVRRQRDHRSAALGPVQVHDRSVFCTLALARFLELPEPDVLQEEIAAVRGVFDPRVLFFDGLGSIVNTPVRRISYDDSLVFGEVHRRVYLDHGFELVEVPAVPLADRAQRVRALLGALSD